MTDFLIIRVGCCLFGIVLGIWLMKKMLEWLLQIKKYAKELKEVD